MNNIKDIEEIKEVVKNLNKIPKVICFTAPKGTGKTSVANIFSKKLEREGFNVHRLFFASALKNMVDALIADIGLSLPVKKEDIFFKNIKIREIYQTLGSEWGRDTIDKNFWAIIVVNKILNISKESKEKNIFIIDDLRFENELEILDIFNAYIFEIYREGIEYTKEHTSEVGLSHLVSSKNKIKLENAKDGKNVIECLEKVAEVCFLEVKGYIV